MCDWHAPNQRGEQGGPCPPPPPPLNPSAPRPSEKKIARGRLSSDHAPLIDRLSGLFTKNLAFYGLFCGPQICQNALAAGAPPRTPLGELTTLPQAPDLLVGWGSRATPPAHSPPSRRPRRRRRLDSRAFGVSILVPPVEAWCPPRCFRAGYGPGDC